MYCKNCGSEIREDHAFCDSCGAIIKIDGAIQPNAVSENPIADATGIKGQVMNKSYLFLAVLIFLCTLGAVGVIVIGRPNTLSSSNKQETKHYETANNRESTDSSELIMTETSSTDHIEENEVETIDSNDEVNSTIDGEEETYADLEEKPDEEEIMETEEDYSIHAYELVVEDVSWSGAYYKALDRGGYLAHINSEEEFNFVSNLIEKEDKRNIIFFIGAYRTPGSSDYYWVNRDGKQGNEIINSDKYSGFWLDGEPSYQGENTDGDMVDEDCLDMFYSKSQDRYVWNDVSDNILEIAPFYAGKIGYICEYENEQSYDNNGEQQEDLDAIVQRIRTVYYDFTGNPGNFTENKYGDFNIYRETNTKKIRCIKCSSEAYLQFANYGKYYSEYYYDNDLLCFVFVYSDDGSEEYRFYVKNGAIVRYIGPYSSSETTHDYYPSNMVEQGEAEQIWQSQFVQLGISAIESIGN